MRLNRELRLAFLAACMAAVNASAQAPQPAAPDAASPGEERERPDVSDAQLGLEVQSRLYQTLEVSNLSALVRYGVATLNGNVGAEEDLQRAEQLALEIEGVDSVVNKLAVNTPVIIALADQAQEIGRRQSSEAETAVLDRLRLDPVLGSRNIRVETDQVGNTVTLSGTVSTSEEKENAGRIAVNAFPTGRIRNQLEIQQRL